MPDARNEIASALHPARQRADVGSAGASSVALDPPVALDHFGAEPSEPRPTAALAAGFGLDQGRTKTAIHRVDQQPGAAIRHAERARCAADRSAGFDRFQQVDLARTDGDVVAAAEAKPELDPRDHAAPAIACPMITPPSPISRDSAACGSGRALTRA